MKVDATVRGIPLSEIPEWAQRCEEVGFDGVFTTETNHDPFFPLVLVAEHTERVELGTGVALAFPRSPVHLAHAAWDLQTLSDGRFILGLGSQIKAHVTKRFSADWSHPARRMRELISAIRAVWTAWHEDAPLDFRGDFYRHTLMPPAFRPDGQPWGPPRIFLAAVRERMAEVAGEVADGLMIHPLQTERYVRETIVPALERGLERAGRTRADVELSLALFTVTTEGEEADVRRRIAFYGSTPAYRGVLDCQGWGELGDELHRLTREGKWDEMAGLVSDDVLETVTVRGETAEVVARRTLERYGELVDRINLHAGKVADPGRWTAIAAAIRQPTS